MTTPLVWKTCRMQAIYHRVSQSSLRYMRYLQARIPSGKDYRPVRNALERAVDALTALDTMAERPEGGDYRDCFYLVETALVRLLTTNLFKADHPTIRLALLEMDKVIGVWSYDIELPVCDKAQ